jgi:predicted small metal-binding protein
MGKVIACECGVTIRGATDDEIVANGQEHARSAHNLDLTRDQVLAIAQPE